MTSHLRGIVLLLVVTAIWGSTFAVVKELGAMLAAPALIAWRFSIGALALLPVLALGRRPAPDAAHPAEESGRRSLPRDGFILGLWLIAGYGTQTIALQSTTANRAAFFTALSVVLVPLWLTLVQRRRLPALLWAALPLAVAGLALLSWEGGAWVVGDAMALPFADASFDRVTISFGIRNVTRIEAALAEFVRVLRPGGRLMVLEFSQMPVPALQWLYDRYSFNVIPPLGQMVANDRDSYQYLVESIRRFPPQERFATMIREAGFDRVSYRNLSMGIAALHSGWKL